jgi:cytochrome P450
MLETIMGSQTSNATVDRSRLLGIAQSLGRGLSPHGDLERPPGPRDPTGGLWNAARLSAGTLVMLRELTDVYGDIVYFKLLGSDYYLLNNPDDIEEAMVRRAASMARDEYVEMLTRALGHGLLTSDGELWQRQRKLMAQAFTPRRIRDYGETMVAVAARNLDLRDREVINLHAEMNRITMEIVAAVLFGAAISGEQVATVGAAMTTLNEFYANSPEAVLMLPRWVPTPLNRRVNTAVEQLDAVVYSIIDRRRCSGEVRHDLLGTLLSACDEGGTGMSDQQLRDEVTTLFLAGHETTSLALAHTIYLLAKHPEIERRLVVELDEVLAGRPPTVEDAEALRYTRQVLDESMRLYPPAWATGREVAREVEIGGYRIPPGAQLLISQWLVHRDPRFYPDPEAFDPDRWLPERVKARPRYAYFPFGGGPRVCIGNHFAMLEATLVLALLMQRHHFELLPGQRLSFTPSVTLRQRGPGLRVRVHRRDASIHS